MSSTDRPAAASSRIASAASVAPIPERDVSWPSWMAVSESVASSASDAPATAATPLIAASKSIAALMLDTSPVASPTPAAPMAARPTVATFASPPMPPSACPKPASVFEAMSFAVMRTTNSAALANVSPPVCYTGRTQKPGRCANTPRHDTQSRRP